MYNHIYDNCVALSILFKFYGLEKEDINFIWWNTWKYNDILKGSNIRDELWSDWVIEEILPRLTWMHFPKQKKSDAQMKLKRENKVKMRCLGWLF